MVKWHDVQFTVGMPHMVPGKLSEVELLKCLGASQWDSITSLLGQRSNEIVNAFNERLYASFINIDLKFQAEQGQHSFDEGTQVFLRNGVRVYANKFIEGITVFSASPIPASVTDAISGREDLDRLEYPWAYITNAFVTRTAGNTRLKVFEPVAMKTRDVPRMSSVPIGIAEHEGVQFSGQVPVFAPGGRLIPLRVRNEGPIQYRIVPESDLNGAGLLYFARYVAMMNYAERVFLSERLLQPWSRQLIAALSTERRKLYYFANADPSDVVRITVTGLVITDITSSEKTSVSSHGSPVKFLFSFTLSRASDNNLMAVAMVHKLLNIPGHEKGVLAELERFHVHNGIKADG